MRFIGGSLRTTGSLLAVLTAAELLAAEGRRDMRAQAIFIAKLSQVAAHSSRNWRPLAARCKFSCKTVIPLLRHMCQPRSPIAQSSEGCRKPLTIQLFCRESHVVRNV